MSVKSMILMRPALNDHGYELNNNMLTPPMSYLLEVSRHVFEHHEQLVIVALLYRGIHMQQAHYVGVVECTVTQEQRQKRMREVNGRKRG